jgi:hypothetical protein
MRLQRKAFGLAFFLLVVTPATLATPATYYVDYTNGLDSNNGTSKSTPWQHAPGMKGASGTASSTTINPGDSVILKGCVTWPNGTMTWTWPFSGSVGNSIYVGVDQTWWDNTVSGCASAWNRPILDAQGTQLSPTNTYNDMFTPGSSHDVQLDNIEMRGLYSIEGPKNNESSFVSLTTSNTDFVYNHLYIHGWISPYFCIGTGNIAANSATITNFVPFSYTPCTGITGWGGSGAAVQAFVLKWSGSGLYWPIQNNKPNVTSLITGSNPYTVVTNSTTNSSACTGCTVQIGADYTFIVAGNESAVSGAMVENSVIDGSDTFEAQLNPYTDCGATEGDNEWCGASAIVNRLPNIWRDNVIRFVQTGFQGECTEWSGNLIEDIRFSTDPSAHTNGIECLDSAPVSGVLLKYGNLFRHWNVANASSDNGGQGSIGLGVEATPQGASTTEYDFDNVAYDTLQNAWMGLHVNGTMGSVVIFNNSSDGGPSWNHSYAPFNECPAAYISCTFNNNHSITNASNQFGGSCGSNCTVGANELVQTVSAAAAQGYNETTTYAFLAGGSTVNAGANLSSYCTAIAAANANAGAACQSDTPYAVSYNSTTHTVTVPARAPNLRPMTSTGCPGNSTCWDVGAYQSVLPEGFTPETVATSGLGGANSGAVASASNTTSETSICSFTLPANELGDNQEIRLHCEGVLTWAAGPNLVITLRAGGTAGTSLGSFSLTFVGTQSSDFGFTCDFSIAANTAPAASVATEAQGGCFVYSQTGTRFIASGALANGSTTAPWATDAPSDMTIDATWSAASSSNAITARLFDAVRLN